MKIHASVEMPSNGLYFCRSEIETLGVLVDAVVGRGAQICGKLVCSGIAIKSNARHIPLEITNESKSGHELHMVLVNAMHPIAKLREAVQALSGKVGAIISALGEAQVA